MYNKIFDEEKWKQVNQENKTIMEDFLLEYKARKMKESTLKQYKNDCRIILLFVLDNCGNRPLTELRKRKLQLTPLFNECVEKGISMKELCPELNNEWNEIIIALNGRQKKRR